MVDEDVPARRVRQEGHGPTGPGRATPRPGRRRRLASGLVTLGTVILLTALAVGWSTVTPGYSWRHSMISDLGSRACVVRGGYRLCSPCAVWISAGVFASGVALSAAACVTRAWDLGMRAGLLSMGCGLALIGAVGSDLSHDVHMAGAVLALPVAAAVLAWPRASVHACASRDVTSDAEASLSRADPARVRTVLSLTALVLCLDHLPGDEHAPIPRGVAEMLAAAALTVAVLWEARRLTRAASLR